MKYLVANWKMNHTAESARAFLNTSRDALRLAQGIEVVICPPFPLIPIVRSEVIGTPIKVGAQNLSQEEEGALTGEVSGLQLEGMCEYVLVGHSERRRLFHETNREIAAKIVQAQRHELKPILCFEKIEDLEAVNDPIGLILAYEPTFAIGTGHPDTPANAAAMAKSARDYLKSDLPVLYGGSVEASNVKEFLQEPGLSGFLVGRASLEPASWVNLVHAASA